MVSCDWVGGGCVPDSPLITWLDHLMGRMGDFQCTGLFASVSKKGFHARLICACLQRREYDPLFPPPTFCFALEEKMGYCHTNHTQHTDSKVVEMVLVEALRGVLSSRLVTVFPSRDIRSGSRSWATLSRPVQNPDRINVYSLGHCVIPPPSIFSLWVAHFKVWNWRSVETAGQSWTVWIQSIWGWGPPVLQIYSGDRSPLPELQDPVYLNS